MVALPFPFLSPIELQCAYQTSSTTLDWGNLPALHTLSHTHNTHTHTTHIAHNKYATTQHIHAPTQHIQTPTPLYAQVNDPPRCFYFYLYHNSVSEASCVYLTCKREGAVYNQK